MTNQLHQHHQPQPPPPPPRRAVDLRLPAIEKYAYCLCLHVKPTTIFIAVFKLIRALLFASILLNSEFAVNEQVNNDLGIMTLEDRHKSTAAAVSILTRIIMASVSAVGIYAVVSGRAALLMPLYAILLVDFFFALPAFYNRELDPSLADSMSDFRTYNTSNNQMTRYSIMLFATITMIVKIYFLCVIWKCYRYLRLIELVSPIRLSEIYPHINANGGPYPIVRVLGSTDSTDLRPGHNLAPPPYESIAGNMKPPNYEEAMKSSCLNYSLATVANTSPNIAQQASTPVTAAPIVATTGGAGDINQPQQQHTVVIANPSALDRQQYHHQTQMINDTHNVDPNNIENNINQGSNDSSELALRGESHGYYSNNNTIVPSPSETLSNSNNMDNTIVCNESSATNTTNTTIDILKDDSS